jgi:hypothetical protein
VTREEERRKRREREDASMTDFLCKTGEWCVRKKKKRNGTLFLRPAKEATNVRAIRHHHGHYVPKQCAHQPLFAPISLYPPPNSEERNNWFHGVLSINSIARSESLGNDDYIHAAHPCLAVFLSFSRTRFFHRQLCLCLVLQGNHSKESVSWEPRIG